MGKEYEQAIHRRGLENGLEIDYQKKKKKMLNPAKS